eukprot:1122238-Rhodomonas_salina.1
MLCSTAVCEGKSRTPSSESSFECFWNSATGRGRSVGLSFNTSAGTRAISSSSREEGSAECKSSA